jgi:hypothetical protein
MSTSSPPHRFDNPIPREPFEHPLSAALREHDTAAIETGRDQPIVDSFALLDHRARAQAIPADTAPDGQYLSFEDGERSWLIELGDKLVHLGRGVSSDLRIEDPRVSRSHAIVVRYGRHARVLDDRSANGTFVNGRRIVAMTLAEGDVVRLGPIAFRYVTIGRPAFVSHERKAAA